MLNGRESLIRLVGKRRHFLPNRQSLLSDPFATHNDSIENTEAEKLVDSKEATKFVSESGSSEKLVTCPVCGHKVSGEHNDINSHLGMPCISLFSLFNFPACTVRLGIQIRSIKGKKEKEKDFYIYKSEKKISKEVVDVMLTLRRT